MNVRLHIERVILEGLPLARSRSEELQSAMEAELTRLLVADGVAEQLRTGGAIARRKGSAVDVGGSDAGEWGRGLARATYTVIGGNESHD